MKNLYEEFFKNEINSKILYEDKTLEDIFDEEQKLKKELESITKLKKDIKNCNFNYNNSHSFREISTNVKNTKRELDRSNDEFFQNSLILNENKIHNYFDLSDIKMMNLNKSFERKKTEKKNSISSKKIFESDLVDNLNKNRKKLEKKIKNKNDEKKFLNLKKLTYASKNNDTLMKKESKIGVYLKIFNNKITKRVENKEIESDKNRESLLKSIIIKYYLLLNILGEESKKNLKESKSKFEKNKEEKNWPIRSSSVHTVCKIIKKFIKKKKI